ncbi:hypothetical protein N431DRAFT_525454 [Stipitochalara longipes BDJ]|nr:hypothetical protein N431DRAFT_525454 [Stipitochalara longipes BDJ]
MDLSIMDSGQQRKQGGGRKRKDRQHPWEPKRRQRPRAKAPSPSSVLPSTAAPQEPGDHGYLSEFAFMAGERIISTPVDIDGLTFTELQPLFRILLNGEMGLTRPDEQRLRHFGGYRADDAPVPDLRFTQQDIHETGMKVRSALGLDTHAIRTLKWEESNFRKTGGTQGDFLVYKKGLRQSLEDHYKRLMVHLDHSEDPTPHSTTSMNTMGPEVKVEDTLHSTGYNGTLEDGGDSMDMDFDGRWVGDQLLELLERELGYKH